MVLITRRYYEGEPPATVMQLSEKMQMPNDLVGDLVRSLINGGYLIEIEGGEEGVVPGTPPEETYVSSLLQYLRASSHEGAGSVRLNTDDRIVTVLATAEEQAVNAIEGLNLKQLAGEEGSSGSD